MVKRLEWTPELIARFWDGLAQLPILERLSFARGAAPLLVPLVQRYLPNGGRILDFGGGHGHLASELLRRGYLTALYEPSTLRADAAREGFASDHPNFLGIIKPPVEVQFDGLFCLEVIEHIPESSQPAFLASLRAMLVDEGLIVLTCPNKEDLDVSTVYCPVCEHAFHRWQHLRSIETKDLIDLFCEAGFETLWLGLIGFEVGEAILQWVQRINEIRNFCFDPELRLEIETDGRRCPDPTWVRSGPYDSDLRLGSERNIVYVGRKMPRGRRRAARIVGRASRRSTAYN